MSKNHKANQMDLEALQEHKAEKEVLKHELLEHNAVLTLHEDNDMEKDKEEDVQSAEDEDMPEDMLLDEAPAAETAAPTPYKGYVKQQEDMQRIARNTFQGFSAPTTQDSTNVFQTGVSQLVEFQMQIMSMWIKGWMSLLTPPKQ